MCTSLLPLAWSARSPCRELTSFMVSCSGLTPPPAARISARFLSNASLYVDVSIAGSLRGEAKPRSYHFSVALGAATTGFLQLQNEPTGDQEVRRSGGNGFLLISWSPELL